MSVTSLQHRDARLVLERRRARARSPRRRARRARSLAASSAGGVDVRLVEELEDALRARHRALEERVALREQAHRLEELLDVLREGDDERERDSAKVAGRAGRMNFVTAGLAPITREAEQTPITRARVITCSATASTMSWANGTNQVRDHLQG